MFQAIGIITLKDILNELFRVRVAGPYHQVVGDIKHSVEREDSVRMARVLTYLQLSMTVSGRSDKSILGFTDIDDSFSESERSDGTTSFPKVM